ncbi:hypothetical protein N8I77_002113 [Diaporthe amygdali]|uniref:Capsule polysaccharide biosynthesis protein n=1 Tax=Phomopsis amygdali TaxID=1214568 RepID=A0AAD9SRX6_PHOAM|nr:hypothetical protein N8I77_002113 [Diaporthe amygdali]
MASANSLGFLLPIGVGAAGAAGLSLLHIDLKAALTNFVTGPGRTSRILLTIFVITNWKSMPFAWTYRVWAAIIRNYIPFLRPAVVKPQMLFHYAITSTYNSIFETDYNLHKSNSTYFMDLDISRSQLVTYLLADGLKAISANAKTKAAVTPDGTVAKGGMGIGLGGVFCSFKKEVALFQGYETWTRILSWDRKWLYLVTHFVVKGKVKPTAWDNGPKSWFGPLRPRQTATAAAAEGETQDFEKYVIATAVSKYVFKVGRFTVNPSIMMEHSGLLPERPGGWRSGANEVGDETQELGDIDFSADAEWDWKRVEGQRREGMKFAEKFAALDGTHGLFDGGEDGALGRFYPG